MKNEKKWSAKVGWATAQIVLQYRVWYCDSRGSRLLDCVATQGRDTAQGRAGGERAGGERGRWAAWARERWAARACGLWALGAGRAERHGHAARHGRSQGPLGALGTALRHGQLGGLGAACVHWLGQIGALCT